MIDLKPEHKKNLIDKIKRVNDKHIIDEIYRLLDIDFNDTVYVTNDRQKKAISQAQEQIKSGQILSDKEANEEIDKWLNK
ncbi:hypothetical protein SAMN05443144_1641 [Fodinibius roseus]|uniref:Addiction module component n=1 Tax=Fodinibius roseus TaxID=1194090 RepID=A0A1M5MGK7_9BACT|nr:hypothetical protein [Fodinibius roseus]SHG76262.1 hypothetical protein SAMN05443144_1641 [Fodinibius roseus]